MGTYIAKRLLQGIPVVLITTFVLFVLIRMIPGDAAAMMAGPTATQEQLTALRKEFGLDQPILWQYVVWVRKVVTGDLGQSFLMKRDAIELIGRAAPATIQLDLTAVAIALFLGIPFGIVAGLKPNSSWDLSLTTISAITLGVPQFLLALLYLLVFALLLGWLPPGGHVDLFGDPGNAWRFMILPAFSMGLPTAAIFARYVRVALVGVLSDDYIRTAHAKGLAPTTVVLRHAMRNALLPLVTVLGMQFGRLLGGTVIIETIFSWPGMGRLAVQSISGRDYYTFQAIILMLVLASVVINLLTDVSYGFLDPRIREQG